MRLKGAIVGRDTEDAGIEQILLLLNEFRKDCSMRERHLRLGFRFAMLVLFSADEMGFRLSRINTLQDVECGTVNPRSMATFHT